MVDNIMMLYILIREQKNHFIGNETVSIWTIFSETWLKNYPKPDTELLVEVKFLFKVHSSQTLLFHWVALSTNTNLYQNLTWLVYQTNLFFVTLQKTPNDYSEKY